MRRTLCLLLMLQLLVYNSLHAQQPNPELRVVSGVLRDADGGVLPGVGIRIKGTDRGTVTDVEGWYRIEVPLGAVLVYSFVGFRPREVTVTTANSAPLNAQGGPTTPTAPATGRNTSNSEKPATVKTKTQKTAPTAKESQKEKAAALPALAQDPHARRGVAVLSDSSPSYQVEGYPHGRIDNVSGPVARIRYNSRKKAWVLTPAYVTANRKLRMGLDFTTSFSSSSPNRLPKLQNTFAQGRAIEGQLQARGPESSELFSWGPPLSTLGYDTDGRLVPWQWGLAPAQAYDPYQALQHPLATDNHLRLRARAGQQQYSAAYRHNWASGLIPTNNYIKQGFDLSIKSDWELLKPKLYLSLSRAREELPQRGANWSSLLGSLYATPPSYDLLAGSGAAKPWKQPGTYQHADGSPRSFAPGLVDHPYWLLNQLPDRQEQQKQVLGLEFSNNPLNRLRLQYKLLYDHNQQESSFGIPPAASLQMARLTARSLSNRLLTSYFSAIQEFKIYDIDLRGNLTAIYDFSHQQIALERTDGSNFAEGAPFQLANAQQTRSLAHDPYRRKHEILTKANLFWSPWYTDDFIQLSLTNQMYFSNTLAGEQKNMFVPGASLAFMLHQLDPFINSSFITYFKPYASFSNNLQEAPLLYNQWHFESLRWSAAQFRRHYEQEELLLPEGLRPEHHQKWEAGLELQLFRNGLDLGFNYYQNLTEQLIAPVWLEDQYELQNVASLKSRGLELSLGHQEYFHNGRWNLGINFSRIRPEVTELYHSIDRVPLAGFSNISTSMLPGQPLGTLWGSRYLRNESGQLVIGPSGFPLADPQQGPIGNPNPNWLGSLTGGASWKGLDFSFVLDARRGGDIWNGTRQFLNYWGRSEQSAEERQWQGFVYEGISQGGMPNQTPVDFYNPSNDFEENRWLRYGEDGVAEDAIETVNWLRLNELQFSYQFNNNMLRALHLRKVKVSLIARNLFVITNYRGIDPLAPLFGYQQGQGLDLFNQPNVRSYGFAINIQL